MLDRRSRIFSVLSSPLSLIPLTILASSSDDNRTYNQNFLMEQSWENWPLLLDLGNVEDVQEPYCHQTSTDDDEEFLRDIFLQQPVSSLSSSSEMDGSDSSVKKLHPSSTPSTPRTFILSFDKSTIIPATTTTTQDEEEEEEEPRTKSRNCGRSNNNKRSLEPKAKTTTSTSQGAKKSRSESQCLDHIMAERKRRLELAQKFIALSATIPDLKKTDKTSILSEAISYVKQLKERVKELEDRNQKNKESTIILNKTDQNLCKSLPDVKARVLENEVLIEIYCEKENGIELKILNMLENLNLIVTASSVLPFGNSTLGFTIIAQMGDGYKMTVNDLVKALREVLLNVRTAK